MAPAIRHSAVIPTATLFAVALVLLILRRPSTVLQAEFWNEDGQVFYVGSWFGSAFEQLTRSYAGYLHLVPRAAAWAERSVDIAVAPLVANSLSLAIVAGLACYIASSRLENIIPTRNIRLALAIGLIVLPGSSETLGSITLVQWYLGIFIVLASLARRPETPAGRTAEGASLVIAGLTGPFVVLFTPLFWARAARIRDAWSIRLAALTTACALIQSIAFATGHRASATFSPDAAVGVLLPRLWSSVIGEFWLRTFMQFGPPLAVALVASAALAFIVVAVWAQTPPLLRGTTAIVVAVVVAAAFASEQPSFPMSPYLGSRYFLIPTFMILLCVAAAVERRPAIASVALGAGLVVGIVGDFSLPGHEVHDWADQSQCIGGNAPCTVPVSLENAWTIHWPGRSGTYVQPTQQGIRE